MSKFLLNVVLPIIAVIAIFMWLQSMYGEYNNVDSITSAWRRNLDVSQETLWENPSPYRGSVVFSQRYNTIDTDPAYEYIRLSASVTNTQAIDLTGWSIESLVSGTRMRIPPAVLMLKIGTQNDYEPVHLAPGEFAIVRTGRSPIEYSFHTNRCTGYLNQFNTFTPRLPETCPPPNEVLSATVENIKAYGADCVDFFASAKRCTTYVTAMPAELLPVCRDTVARTLNYNTCLRETFEQEGYDIFDNGGWYLYLNSPAELWGNEYEALRLLDANGRTVDVLTY